jgi:hypothetical protein
LQRVTVFRQLYQPIVVFRELRPSLRQFVLKIGGSTIAVPSIARVVPIA